MARVHSRPHRASRLAPGKHPLSKPARWDDLETQIPLEVILASQLHNLFQRPGERTGVCRLRITHARARNAGVGPGGSAFIVKN
jgi:hypothetical protein